MSIRIRSIITLVCIALLGSGCAALSTTDPLQVTVAGIEPLQGQGMELRLMVKLRVQNPNDAPVLYNGIALQMNVQGKTFATGVSDASGDVPRFSEAIIAVPVTISAFRLVRQALGMASGDTRKITYEMKGKLSGSGFVAKRFATRGEFDMPTPAHAPTSDGEAL